MAVKKIPKKTAKIVRKPVERPIKKKAEKRFYADVTVHVNHKEMFIAFKMMKEKPDWTVPALGVFFTIMRQVQRAREGDKASQRWLMTYWLDGRVEVPQPEEK